MRVQKPPGEFAPCLRSDTELSTAERVHKLLFSVLEDRLFMRSLISFTTVGNNYLQLKDTCVYTYLLRNPTFGASVSFMSESISPDAVATSDLNSIEPTTTTTSVTSTTEQSAAAMSWPTSSGSSLSSTSTSVQEAHERCYPTGHAVVAHNRREHTPCSTRMPSPTDQATEPTAKGRGPIVVWNERPQSVGLGKLGRNTNEWLNINVNITATTSNLVRVGRDLVVEQFKKLRRSP